MQEFCEAKDYLNLRYIYKRALFLCCVAEHLLSSGVVEKVEFSHHHGNQSKPILVLTPPGSLEKKLKIHVHISLEEGSFKCSRFHVTKNNIRQQWFDGSNEEKEGRTKTVVT